MGEGGREGRGEGREVPVGLPQMRRNEGGGGRVPASLLQRKE